MPGRIENLDKFMRRLASLYSPRSGKLLGAALLEAGDIVAAEASRLITTGSSSGQSGGKHQHVPSAPGQPPNEEFGDLRRGIDVTQPDPFEVIVEGKARHSVPLEFGTSKMAARPFFRPARDSKSRAARKRFAEQVERILRGAAE